MRFALPRSMSARPLGRSFARTDRDAQTRILERYAPLFDEGALKIVLPSQHCGTFPNLQ
jgi:hypothetical protein